MLKINDIANYLIQKFPLQNQEEWDNCGLFYNFYNFNCYGIVVGLDVTHDLINCALKKNANLIITHHPIYLKNPDLKISDDKKELIQLLQTNKIVHLCLHTCFDKAPDGTSYQILKRLPLIENFYQLKEYPYIFVANLKKIIQVNDYINLIDFKKYSNQPIVYDQSLSQKTINKIALCAGSGGFFVHSILDNKIADCYLCGDIKWHDWLDAHDNQFPLIDINHATEAVFIEYISELIQKNFNLETVKVFPTLRLVHKN